MNRNRNRNKKKIPSKNTLVKFFFQCTFLLLQTCILLVTLFLFYTVWVRRGYGITSILNLQNCRKNTPSISFFVIVFVGAGSPCPALCVGNIFFLLCIGNFCFTYSRCFFPRRHSFIFLRVFRPRFPGFSPASPAREKKLPAPGIQCFNLCHCALSIAKSRVLFGGVLFTTMQSRSCSFDSSDFLFNTAPGIQSLPLLNHH